MARMGRPKKSEQSEDSNEALEGILKSLTPDGGWTVKIFRRKYGTTEQEWLADRSPDEMTESPEMMIAAKWGPGRYLVRAWSAALKQWAPSKTLVISQEAAEEAGFDMNSGGPYPAYVPNGGGDTKDFLMLMQQSNDRLMAIMSQSSDRQMQSFQTMMGGLTTVMAAMMGGRQQVDPIALAQLFKDNGSSTENLKNIIAIAKDLAPNGGGNSDNDPFLSILGKTAEAILPKMLERPAVLPLPPQQITSGTAVAASVQNPPGEQMPPEILEQLQFLNRLKAKAIKDTNFEDVDHWADHIERNDDEEGPKRILFLVEHFSWEEIIAGLEHQDADFKTNEHLRSWFKKLHEALTAEEASGNE